MNECREMSKNQEIGVKLNKNDQNSISKEAKKSFGGKYENFALRTDGHEWTDRAGYIGPAGRQDGSKKSEANSEVKLFKIYNMYFLISNYRSKVVQLQQQPTTQDVQYLSPLQTEKEDLHNP